MAGSSPRADARSSTLPFLLVSVLLHLLLLVGVLSHSAALVRLKLPDQVEIGMVEADPGTSGSPPPPAAAPLVPAAPKHAPEPKPPAEPEQDSTAIVVDASVASAPDAAASSQASELAALAPADAGAPAARSGDGSGMGAVGEGLGFGAGGFGSGTGVPPGAIIALHADLDRIRNTSLILETEALLEIIPEWQRLLQGSGLDPLADFSRVFVATPNLRRSQLVLSARLRGGEAALAGAVQRLARERGLPALARAEAGVKLWPWHDRGPTERVAGLFSADQIVIARPSDVTRVLAVSAALAQRHAAQPGMERAQPPAALLSMYEQEAIALSVEGVREFVSADLWYAPSGLRISLQHLDEYHARLRAFGYYGSAEQAARALEHLEGLRGPLAEHPRTLYLGLRAAIAEATLSRAGATLTLETRVTMHQTRYLLEFVSRALAPR